MTVATAVARMTQIEAWVNGTPTVPAATTTGAMTAATTNAGSTGTSFASALSAQTGSGVKRWSTEIQAAAAKYDLDPKVLSALVQQESGGNPSARSKAGAVGLCQLMPATAAGLGVTNPLDPAQSLDAGAKYLRQQLDAFGGDMSKALAAYNAGPGAVQRYGGVPPFAETQNYVKTILANAEKAI